MFTDYLSSPIGLLEICADHTCILSLRVVADNLADTRANELTDLCKNQLAEYMCGKRATFNLPIKLVGSPFQVAVWRKLQEIPYGQTACYQNVATSLGKSKAQRAVGAANAKNRIAIIVPCHRIVNKNGESGGYAYGASKKEWLLRHESASGKPV